LKIEKHQRARKDLGLKRDFLDLTELIRSIQRREGNLDCFGRGQAHCEEPECSWRLYCLEQPQHMFIKESRPCKDDKGCGTATNLGFHTANPK
jgi:hypothetical protein